MNESDKFMRMFGGIFFSVGMLLLGIAAFLLIAWQFFAGGICLLLGVVFSAIGGGILISQMKASAKVKAAMKNGVKYTGKIYGYVDDTSFTMNGAYLVNIKVHYFDEQGIEREAVVPTRFTRGTGGFPIGATIDIIKADSYYTWVQGSVRYEALDREDELMDDKPLAPEKLNMIAVSCQGCGASFTAAKGYASKCPYCGASINC